MRSYHEPVMPKETIDFLRPAPGKIYIDATLGGGGHTWDLYSTGAHLISTDVDYDAIAECINRFAAAGVPITQHESTNIYHGERITLVRENFRNLQTVLSTLHVPHVDGILFDLGVSSHQFDSKERGFTYRLDGPLDLRLDQSQGEPASHLLNSLSEGEIYDLIARYGEEELAGPIAHAFVLARQIKPIETTGQLVEVIQKKVPGLQKFGVLSRVFQALRIAVNDELAALSEGLEEGIRALSPGGKIVVMSYHSLEDRIVKLRFMKSDVSGITKKPVTASQMEVGKNRRSRSAKLRVAQKI